MHEHSPKKPGRAPMPAAFFKRWINPITGFLLRSPAGRGMGKVLLLLSYTGRKSGQRFTTPVSYTRDGPVFTLFTDSAWALNFIEPAPVEILVERRTLRGTARTFSDPQVVAQGILDELATHGRMAAQRHGIRPGDTPDLEDVMRVNAGRRMVRIVVNEG